MGKTYTEIDARCADFLRAQPLFFVATAPLAGDGLVNCSPKGLDTFALLDTNTVAYLDLTGSGIETVAHLRENGRIVFLFCAFEGAPKIVRLHGRGEVIEPGDPQWSELAAHFPTYRGARAIVRAHITRVADSCGFGVPLMRFEGERDQLAAWADRKGEDGIRAYQRERNTRSLDQLPGLRGPADQIDSTSQ